MCAVRHAVVSSMCCVNMQLPLQVRPSFVEASVQRRATSSVAHHLLVNYQRAHVAIIKAQFTCKRLRDGMEVRLPP
jgi:hypothetical protein